MLGSFLLFVISLFIPANSDVINQVNSYSSDISETPVFEKINFSYNGVSFSYLDNWEITDNSDIEVHYNIDHNDSPTDVDIQFGIRKIYIQR